MEIYYKYIEIYEYTIYTNNYFVFYRFEIV